WLLPSRWEPRRIGSNPGAVEVSSPASSLARLSRLGSRQCRREQLARGGFLDDDRGVFRKQESLRRELLRGDPDAVHIIVAAVIALLDRQPLVAGLFAFGLGGRERQERSDQHAGERLRLVLSAIGADRYGDVGQPHAAERVAVLVALRHLNDGGRKLAGRAQRGRIGAGGFERHQLRRGWLGVVAHPGIETQQQGARYRGPI